MFQLRPCHRDGIEILRVRPETQCSAGVALADLPYHLQRADRLAVGKGHVVFVAVPFDPHFQVFRQAVDHGHAHAVQATGEPVILVGKLAPRVQAGEDDFHAGEFLARVYIHGYAPAVVCHRDGVVLVQDDLDLVCVFDDGLIDAVVHHFLHQVIGPGSVGVHARPLAHRLETG